MFIWVCISEALEREQSSLASSSSTMLITKRCNFITARCISPLLRSSPGWQSVDLLQRCAFVSDGHLLLLRFLIRSHVYISLLTVHRGSACHRFEVTLAPSFRHGICKDRDIFIMLCITNRACEVTDRMAKPSQTTHLVMDARWSCIS